jgi:hypothetical protein
MSEDTEQLSWFRRQASKGMFWVGLVFINSTLIFFLLAVVFGMGVAGVNLYISNGIAIVLLWIYRGKLEWSGKTLSELPDENVPQDEIPEEQPGWFRRQSRNGMFWIKAVFINHLIVVIMLFPLREPLDDIFHFTDRIYVTLLLKESAYLTVLAILLLLVFRGKLDWSKEDCEKRFLTEIPAESDTKDEKVFLDEIPVDKETKDYPDIETKDYPEID